MSGILCIHVALIQACNEYCDCYTRLQEGGFAHNRQTQISRSLWHHCLDKYIQVGLDCTTLSSLQRLLANLTTFDPGVPLERYLRCRVSGLCGTPDSTASKQSLDHSNHLTWKIHTLNAKRFTSSVSIPYSLSAESQVLILGAVLLSLFMFLKIFVCHISGFCGWTVTLS